MKRKTFSLIMAAVVLLAIRLPVYAEGSTAVTTTNEYGYESTIITDENGNTIVFEYVDDDGSGEMHDEVDPDDGENESGQNSGASSSSSGTMTPADSTTVPSNGTITVVSGDGTRVSTGSGTSTGGRTTSSTRITASANAGEIGTAVKETTSASQTDAAETVLSPNDAATVHETTGEANNVLLQQGSAAIVDSGGNATVDSRVFDLLKWILFSLVLLVAAIIGLIVVLLTRRKSGKTSAEQHKSPIDSEQNAGNR